MQQKKIHITAKFTSQYQQLLDMLNKQNNQLNNTFVNTSKLTGMLCLSTFHKHEWIIDSGASDHMCCELSKFSSYETISNKEHLASIPNGRRITINNAGSVVLDDNIVLNQVLYVPQFKFNLIYVDKFVKDNNCAHNFHTNGCYVQEMKKRKA